MKRLLLLVLGLVVLSMSIIAMPAYPKTDATYPLPNGHKITLEFYAPKEALPFFDPSILVNGFAKIADTYKINEDFGLSFVVHTDNWLQLGIHFDHLKTSDIEFLKPIPGNGLYQLPFIVPRDAINTFADWFSSFASNKDPDKPEAFLVKVQRATFFIDYDCISISKGTLAITGTFSGKPVFDSTMSIEDYSTLTFHKITLDPRYDSWLQNFHTFVLNPLDDLYNPGLRTENIFVYWLFGLPPPPPAK